MKKEELPVDRGWAWVICLSSFMTTFITSNSFQMLSVILLDLKDEFESSITVVSLIIMFKVFCMSFTAIISVNFLVPKFGLRPTCVFGGFIYFVCGILYAFAPNVGVFIALATVRGIMIGVISVPSLSLVGFYFNKYRSIAITITVCGISLSSMTWPRLIRWVMTRHDLQGTMMLNGALEGNVMAACMLLRPLSLYRMPKHKDEDEKKLDDVIEVSPETINNSSIKNNYHTHIQDSTTINLLAHNKMSADDTDCPMTDKSNFSRSRNELNSENNNSEINELENGFTQVSSDTKTDNCETRTEEKNPYGLNSLHSKHGESRIPSEKTEISIHGNEFPVDSIQNGQTSSRISDENPELVDELESSPKDSLLKSDSESKTPFLQTDKPNFQGQNPHPNLNKEDSLLHKVLHTKPSTSHPGMGSSLEVSTVGIAHFSSAWSLVSGFDGAPPVFASVEAKTEVMDKEPMTFWQKANEILDFSLFKQWAFIWALIGTFPCGSNSFIFVYLPTISTLKGMTKDEGALMLSILGAMDLCARIATGFLADTKRISVTTIIGVSGFCLGFTCMFMGFVEDFTGLVIMSLVIAMFVGIRVSLASVMCIEIFGVKKMAKAFSVFSMCVAIAFGIHNPMLGKMLETVGPNAVMYYIGCTSFLWGFIFISIPLVIRMERKFKKLDVKNLE